MRVDVGVEPPARQVHRRDAGARVKCWTAVNELTAGDTVSRVGSPSPLGATADADGRAIGEPYSPAEHHLVPVIAAPATALLSYPGAAEAAGYWGDPTTLAMLLR